MSRPSALTLVLTELGNGSVVTVAPAEDLLPPQDQPGPALVRAPFTPRAANVRLFEGLARTRPGYGASGITGGTGANAYGVLARFSHNVNEVLRLRTTAVERLTAGAWVALSISPTPTNTSLSNYWSTTMARRAGSQIGNQLFLANGHDNDPLYYYEGGGIAITGVASAFFKGPRAIVGHRGRLLAMNVRDASANVRRYQRIYFSLLGDPRTFTGTGSGFTDADDDPFPIIAGMTISGNVAVFKGTVDAGSIVVLTPTGNANSPYRLDTLNTNNVGLLLPNTLIGLTPEVTFFVGHDGFYFYDGGRGLAPVADTISRDVIARVNKSALYAGITRYDSKKHELLVGIPTGSDTFASEFWRIDSRTRRVIGGPDTYADAILSTVPYELTGVKLIGDYPVGENFGNTPSSPIGDITGPSASGGVLLFTAAGATFLDDGTATLDNATAITGEYVTPAINPHKYILANGRRLEHDTMLSLRDVALIWRNEGTWTPTVAVSIDGGTTWTTISDGVALGPALATNRLHTTNYTADTIASSVFQIRVRGAAAMRLMGIRMEFSYAGSARND